MSIQFGLNIVTLVMCIITLTMATAALMPQIKRGLAILRDGLLWSLLMGIVGFVGVVGWTRLHEVRQQRADDSQPVLDLQDFRVPEVPSATDATELSALAAPGIDYSAPTAYASPTATQIRPNQSWPSTALRTDSQLQPVYYEGRHQAGY